MVSAATTGSACCRSGRVSWALGAADVSLARWRGFRHPGGRGWGPRRRVAPRCRRCLATRTRSRMRRRRRLRIRSFGRYCVGVDVVGMLSRIGGGRPADASVVGIECGGGCWRGDGWRVEKESWAVMGAVEQQRPSAMRECSWNGRGNGLVEGENAGCQRPS